MEYGAYIMAHLLGEYDDQFKKSDISEQYRQAMQLFERYKQSHYYKTGNQTLIEVHDSIDNFLNNEGERKTQFKFFIDERVDTYRRRWYTIHAKDQQSANRVFKMICDSDEWHKLNCDGSELIDTCVSEVNYSPFGIATKEAYNELGLKIWNNEKAK